MYVYGELARAQLENLSADPSAALAGRIYWQTTTGRLSVDTGAVIKQALLNDQHIVIGTHATAGNNLRFNRAGSTILQLVPGSDTTAEGSGAATLAQLGQRVESFIAGTLPAAANAGRIIWQTDTSLLKLDNGAAWLTLVDTTTAQTLTNKSILDATSSIYAAAVKSQAATSGYVLTADGAGAADWLVPPTGKILNTQVFTTNGNWTAPAGVTRALIFGRGGSGGGAAGTSGGGGLGGNGGGGACTVVQQVTVVPTTIYAVTIGAAGAAGAVSGGTGGTGGDTTFDVLATFKGATGGVVSTNASGAFNDYLGGWGVSGGGEGGRPSGTSASAGRPSAFAAGGAKGGVGGGDGSGGGGGDGAGGAGGANTASAGSVGTNGGGGGGGGGNAGGVAFAGGAGTVGQLTVMWLA